MRGWEIERERGRDKEWYNIIEIVIETYSKSHRERMRDIVREWMNEWDRERVTES